MSVNVGDKVRLLGWEGTLSWGLVCDPTFVGLEAVVDSVDGDGTVEVNIGRVEVLCWPLSKVEKIEPVTVENPVPKLFDPDNTTDWQSEGNCGFLLQSTRRGCGTATENKFYFQINSARRLDPDGERELAERICRLLNEDHQRRDSGK